MNLQLKERAMDKQAMTRAKILEKAITKAIDGGWRGDLLGELEVIDYGQGILEIRNQSGEEWSVEEIIFNHEVAKALWPNKVIDGLERELWKGRLQMMVISKDPIAYLGRNI